uniref:Myb/SANT-like DNA-binding domain-containing protein n=1 Tax=Knipowitschia caucasica TaxID=637954 RepID=A0AAV2LVI1_KNICA
MAVRGYPRTLQQCRDKLKKLKSDYRAINRRSWRWFAEMDAIYGHRPSNNGRECGVDSASSLLLSIEDQSLPTTEMTDEPPRSPSPIPGEPPAAASTQAAASITAESEISSNTQRVVTGTRRRGLFESDTVAVLREMHAADREEHALDREEHAWIGKSMRWIGKSMRWIGKSMRWIGKSMRWIGKSMRWIGKSMRWIGKSMRWIGHALDRAEHALDRAEHALNRAQRDAHLQEYTTVQGLQMENSP